MPRAVKGRIKRMGGTYDAYTMGKIMEDLSEVRDLARQIIGASNKATKMAQQLKIRHDPKMEEEWTSTMKQIMNATKQINYIVMEKRGRFR